MGIAVLLDGLAFTGPLVITGIGGVDKPAGAICVILSVVASSSSAAAVVVVVVVVVL